MVRSICLSLRMMPMLFLGAIGAYAGETDQYLVWDVELRDSAAPLNAYLNTQIEAYLLEEAGDGDSDISGEELAMDLYRYFFRGLHASRVRRWLFESEEIDRFPGRSVTYFQYHKMSIYRHRIFPPWMPMSRTIRIGQVYLGVDKISHFFGFGRRYFERYARHLKDGLSDEEAMEEVVNWGVFMENRLVGGLVDGIFSHADLESNFQGMLFAKALCMGDRPYLAKNDGVWTLTRPIDIRKYVTPDFDESYNSSHFWGIRKRKVLPILHAEYKSKFHSPVVQARFTAYAESEPSFSRRLVEAHFAKKRCNPLDEQSLHALFVEVPEAP